jgi:hypothetical protein
MVQGVPATITLTCPREHGLRRFGNIDGGVTFRCSGCEWTYTLGTKAPTGTTNASASIGATTISVASGGASFTSGMQILWDTGSSAEVVTATATGSATSIPVTAAIKAHNSAVAIGQLSVASTYSSTGEDAIPSAPGWGF